MTEPHVHVWSLTGVRFRNGHWDHGGPLLLYRRHYCHHFFCAVPGCGAFKTEPLGDEQNNWTHEPILHNASPATELEFPIEDEKEPT